MSNSQAQTVAPCDAEERNKMTKIKVNDKNRNYIISKHAESVVNEMDMGTLRAIARDSIESKFWPMSNSMIEKTISEYNPQVLENKNND